MPQTLIDTDWNREWMELQNERRHADDSAFWDARAKHFRSREMHPYARDFLRLANISPIDTVLDMGCGGGSLAIPLARSGAHVLACDFSPKMLEVLGQSAEEEGLCERIEPRILSWDDDWEAAEVRPKSVDVALASRSIATHDLKGALEKLDRSARKRCCITLIANASPRVDAHVMDAIGAAVSQSRDFVYAFNILIGMGRLPRVSYIESPRKDTFDSTEDAYADFARMLKDTQDDPALYERLRAYLTQHIVPNPEAGMPGQKDEPQGALMLDHTRIVRWAFISWEPKPIAN